MVAMNEDDDVAWIAFNGMSMDLFEFVCERVFVCDLRKEQWNEMREMGGKKEHTKIKH